MSKKICKAIKDKVHKDEPKKYKKLVKGAKYYCTSCGHVAADSDHLCKAKKL